MTWLPAHNIPTSSIVWHITSIEMCGTLGISPAFITMHDGYYHTYLYFKKLVEQMGIGPKISSSHQLPRTIQVRELAKVAIPKLAIDQLAYTMTSVL